jgi:hypothetical protein
MVEYSWRPLGELLVKRGLIDEHRLESLLLEQRLSGQLFGEMLVAKRVVSADELAAVVAQQHGLHLEPSERPTPPEPADSDGKQWRPLGRVLVERNLLTESGLQRVLMTQRRKGGLLGQLLLERGYVTPDQLAEALAEQHGLPIESVASAPVARNEPERDAGVFYEVRERAGEPDDMPLHVSPSFLDASDFAFELLYDTDPDALEIVEVKDDERRIAWSYERPAA